MMKKYIFLIAGVLSFMQAQEYKSVFDCSSNNARFVMTRMNLIERTMNMIEKDGDKANFAITIHGGCVPMVSDVYDEIVPDEDMPYIKMAQESIIRLSQTKKVKIIVCAMSLNAHAIDQKEVLPFIHISKNSFIDTIGLQNKGYALMTFK
jgi:intracellular sulfur oxidation DsrE/DsrF family protein